MTSLYLILRFVFAKIFRNSAVYYEINKAKSIMISCEQTIKVFLNPISIYPPILFLKELVWNEAIIAQLIKFPGSEIKLE